MLTVKATVSYREGAAGLQALVVPGTGVTVAWDFCAWRLPIHACSGPYTASKTVNPYMAGPPLMTLPKGNVTAVSQSFVLNSNQIFVTGACPA